MVHIFNGPDCLPRRKETPVSSAPTAQPFLRIQPQKGWIKLNLSEMWQNRELLYFLSLRDITVKYKQTLLGLSWAILNPVLNTFIFTVIFGMVSKLPTDGLPQPVFYMSGLIIWKYFADALTGVSNSMVGASHLLTKIYFPRLFIPLSLCVAYLVDLLIAFVLLLLLMAYYHLIPPGAVFFLPLLVLIAMGTALGVGLFFAALNVRFRDVKMLVPFMIQIWMYATVIFPFSKLPESLGNWRYLWGLNPMCGVVEGFRWCLLHHRMLSEVNTTLLDPRTIETFRITDPLTQKLALKVVEEGTLQIRLIESAQIFIEPPLVLLGIGIPVMGLCLLGGLFFFRRVENQFADIV
jgi:lipopolysaccharide transport system permease protein